MGYIRPVDLEVYKRAFSVAIELHKLSLEWPKIEQYGGIADQIRRASKSICANLAEGLGKHMSAADKRKFVQIALGSAEETGVWLQFSVELGYLHASERERLAKEYGEICSMLYGLMQKIQ
ncbi:MAG: four helix bundle protein [Alphaproteobacteria bacterium CG_4_10_14_0_8_um_filter_53_9]|nr:MAG: four helix bundle protein [Alphaproteobacteria bacterium CG_4_10_14_0_8_um_filter_53_9]